METKTLIIIILSIITSISISLFAITFKDAKDDWFSWNINLLWILPMMLILNISIWTITAYLRKIAMRYSGFNEQDIKLVFGPRDDFDLEYFKNNYNVRKIKMIDGWCRKSNHIITSIINLLLITTWIDDESLKYQVAFLGQLVNVFISYFTLYSKNRLSFPLYGSSSRIRDGTMGRINLLVVRYVSLCTVISIGSIMSIIDGNDDEKNLLLAIIYIPTAFGDAAGELVGSTWGYHDFKVYGIGEINKKSIEGTIAVFFFSIFPMLIVIWVRNQFDKLLLIFIISIQSTILEVVSIRSTDNFLLPIMNAFVVYLRN